MSDYKDPEDVKWFRELAITIRNGGESKKSITNQVEISFSNKKKLLYDLYEKHYCFIEATYRKFDTAKITDDGGHTLHLAISDGKTLYNDLESSYIGKKTKDMLKNDWLYLEAVLLLNDYLLDQKGVWYDKTNQPNIDFTNEKRMDIDATNQVRNRINYLKSEWIERDMRGCV